MQSWSPMFRPRLPIFSFAVIPSICWVATADAVIRIDKWFRVVYTNIVQLQRCISLQAPPIHYSFPNLCKNFVTIITPRLWRMSYPEPATLCASMGCLGLERCIFGLWNVYLKLSWSSPVISSAETNGIAMIGYWRFLTDSLCMCSAREGFRIEQARACLILHI